MQITDKFTGTEETNRQLAYIEKARGYVSQLADRIGRKPTCCVTTFGCQCVLITEKLSQYPLLVL